MERTLLAVMSIAMLVLPVIFVATSLLAFADYGLNVIAFSIGIACLAIGLWLFARSHADLGDNWSISLEVREGHTLITGGVYRQIRHPMYTAILLLAIAQALLLANWIAGPASVLVLLLMLALRRGPEERMMVERFGDTYTVYCGQTKRFIPRVW